jgi:Zn-dependent protease with chaperone function
MRRSSPGLRYWLWQIAAIKLLVMPLWGVAILLPAIPRRDAGTRSEMPKPARSGGEIGPWPADRRRGLDHYAPDDGRRSELQEGLPWTEPLAWQAWLLLGWGLGVIGQVGVIANQRKMLERLLRHTTPGDDPALLDLVTELSGRIGLRLRPDVMITDGDGSPFVCGLSRPALVLPRALARALDVDAFRSVLLHELTHIERRDLLWDWIPAIARVLYFFHPAAHYIVYRARLERELACDQAAMVMTGQGAAGYASILVEVVSRSTTPPAMRAVLASARLDAGEPRPADVR